jgi:hypothetical protein
LARRSVGGEFCFCCGGPNHDGALLNSETKARQILAPPSHVNRFAADPSNKKESLSQSTQGSVGIQKKPANAKCYLPTKIGGIGNKRTGMVFCGWLLLTDDKGDWYRAARRVLSIRCLGGQH